METRRIKTNNPMTIQLYRIIQHSKIDTYYQMDIYDHDLKEEYNGGYAHPLTYYQQRYESQISLTM